MAGGKRFRRIYLHIGLGKTGSTSIQQALLAGAERLETAFDIHYPRVFDDPRPFGGNHTLYLRSLFIDHPETKRPNIVAGLDTPEAIARANDSLLHHFRQGFDASNASQLLLSAEGIGHFNTVTLRRLKTWLDTLGEEIIVIVCVRHPAHALASEIQQRLKTGRELANLYRNPPHYKLRQLFTDLSSIFGHEAIRAYDFAEAIHSEGGVVGCFLHRIGIADQTGFDPGEVLNRSLSHEATLLLDSLNRQRPLVTDDGVNPLRTRGDLQLLVHIPGRRYQPPAEVYAELERLVAGDLSWLQAQHGLGLDSMGAGAAAEAMQDWSPDSVDDLALKLSDLANLRAANRSDRAPAAVIRQRKPLVIHIGMGKTGTTSLQEFFWRNRAQLAARGVLYPEFGAEAHAHHLLSPHVPDYMRERWHFLTPAEWAPQLADQALSRVLLSSEVMFSANAAEISAYFKVVREYFEPRVVVYLRRQDHLISSQFNQLVKSGRQKRRLGQVLERQIANLDYAGRLGPWAQALGDEAILVRPYEPEQLYRGDIRHDFMHHALGQKTHAVLEMPGSNPNPRFPVDVLEYKRNLNWLVKDRAMHRRCNVLLQDYSSARPEQRLQAVPDSFLGPAQRGQVLDAVAASNSEVARRYLGRDDGRLFLEPRPAQDASWVELAMGAEQVAEISAFICQRDRELGAQIKALAEANLDTPRPFLREAAEIIAASFT